MPRAGTGGRVAGRLRSAGCRQAVPAGQGLLQIDPAAWRARTPSRLRGTPLPTPGVHLQRHAPAHSRQGSPGGDLPVAAPRAALERLIQPCSLRSRPSLATSTRHSSLCRWLTPPPQNTHHHHQHTLAHIHPNAPPRRPVSVSITGGGSDDSSGILVANSKTLKIRWVPAHTACIRE